MVEGFTFVKLHVNLSGQHVRIAYREPIVVAFVSARVCVRPSDVRTASQIVGKGRGHPDAWLAAVVGSELVGIPRGDRDGFPRVEGHFAVTGEVGLVQANIENFFVR